MTAHLLGEMCATAGLPPGVRNIVPGLGVRGTPGPRKTFDRAGLLHDGPRHRRVTLHPVFRFLNLKWKDSERGKQGECRWPLCPGSNVRLLDNCSYSE